MEASLGRIGQRTVAGLNTKLQKQAEARVAYYSAHPEEIEQRLHELDEEWDIERAIETEAAGTVLTGFVLGLTINKRWFLLPAFVGAMLVLHSVRGTYPLLPLFRRMGLRTAHEIERERYALKALRGDFKHLRQAEGPKRARLAFEAADPALPTGGALSQVI